MGVWDNGVLVHFLASFAVASFIDLGIWKFNSCIIESREMGVHSVHRVVVKRV
jgi:hypothetical protein